MHFASQTAFTTSTVPDAIIALTLTVLLLATTQYVLDAGICNNNENDKVKRS